MPEQIREIINGFQPGTPAAVLITLVLTLTRGVYEKSNFSKIFCEVVFSVSLVAAAGYVFNGEDFSVLLVGFALGSLGPRVIKSIFSKFGK